MANTKKPPTQTRRDRVEEMRRQQQQAERRKNLVFLTVAIVVALGLVLAAVLPSYFKHKNDLTRKNLSALGVSTAAASCDAITDDPAAQSGVHVGPGTNQPNVTKVKYADVPPSWGEHFVNPVYPNHAFYTVADGHQVEEFVHNLEHGYTILWYDRSVEKEQAAAFQALATKVNAMKESANKFLIVPWNPAYGSFPAGKKYALSHWAADVDQSTGKVGKQTGHRQLCGGLSTTVVEDFVKKFPWSSAPEPGAA